MCEFGNALPVAIVIKEPPCVTRLEVLGCIGTRLMHVAFDACPEFFNPGLEQSPDENDPLGLIVCNVLFGNQRRWHLALHRCDIDPIRGIL
jgi:hypothetical protein